MEPLNSKMAPSTEKSRQGIRMNISTEVQKTKTYELEIMTLKIANELDGAREKLKRFFEKYMEDSQKI